MARRNTKPVNMPINPPPMMSGGYVDLRVPERVFNYVKAGMEHGARMNGDQLEHMRMMVEGWLKGHPKATAAQIDFMTALHQYATVGAVARKMEGAQ